MRKFILSAILSLIAAVSFAEEPPTDAFLVYPSAASVAEALDNSSPAKRAVPPVNETSEDDVVTPIGQVQGVLRDLRNLGAGQKEISSSVDSLTRDAKSAKEDRIAIATKLASIAVAPARSKIADMCIFITTAVVILQTIILCGKTIVNFVSVRRQRLEEQIAEKYLQRAEQNKKASVSRL